MSRPLHLLAAVALAGLLAACSSSGGSVGFDSTVPPATDTTPPSDPTPTTAVASTAPQSDGALVVRIDPTAAGDAVSPFIRGLTGAPADYLESVGATLNNWGGNTASRYNLASPGYTNAGRSTNYANQEQPPAATISGFLDASAAAGVSTRVALPTLGWVAKDGAASSCSFRGADGSCTRGDDASCTNPTAFGDPTITSVRAPADQNATWLSAEAARGRTPAYLAMDNEPELWGETHFDVHPQCSTYEEILASYLANANAVRPVAPTAKLTGPVMCCWYSHWLNAPGLADGTRVDFLTWFLGQVRANDDANGGTRMIDALDVHYYPQSEVYNDAVDPDTSALRLRSTRSLYDPTYIDESWVRSEIVLVPRLKAMIEDVYPGTELAISEWNFGADTSMNGALAIADVLGIFGREGVDVAAYSDFPQAGSPGYFAFAMHGNYDGAGAAFEGTSVLADSPDIDTVGAYATVEGSTVKVMLLNKQPTDAALIDLAIDGIAPGSDVRVFSYSDADPSAIVASTFAWSDTAVLEAAPYSITVLELTLDS